MENITLTPVVEILRNCKGSGDFGDIVGDSTEWWERVITTKAADSGFGHLVESYLEHGWLEGSAVGWVNGQILNGHHRLVMAILLGLDYIPTVDMWGSQPEPPEGHANSGSTHGCFEDPYPILLTDDAEPYNAAWVEDEYDPDDSFPCRCSLCV